MDLFPANKPSVLLTNTPVACNFGIASLLREIYDIETIDHDADLMQIASQASAADLIFLDINLHDNEGHAICRQLKDDPSTWSIPVILFDDATTDEKTLKGFACGADDYIPLPINPAILTARVKAQIARRANIDLVRLINEQLEEAVAKRTGEIAAVQDATILAMTSLAQTRDTETGNHIRRTQHYVQALSKQLQSHPRFSDHLTDSAIDLLFKSAPLHDIGKIGIPDRILLKPGRFTPAEMEIMKTHTTLGREAIEYAENQLGCKLDFLTIAKEIAYSHQEKWDGSGYPQGLVGEEIPISARLMALADVYDAIISRRVYKEGMPHEKAVEIITEGKGRHFDPDIVDAFLSIAEKFKAIAAHFTDSDDDMQKKADYLVLATQTDHVKPSRKPEPAGSREFHETESPRKEIGIR